MVGKQTRERETETLLILGASGDLTARLLLPGLASLLATGVADGLTLLGSAREDWDDERWGERVADSFAQAGMSGRQIERVVSRARYMQADVTDEGDMRRLLDACEGTAIVYFAVPPAMTEKACEVLAQIGVPDGTRLVMEKPFGRDLRSAEALNRLIARLVPEDHVHRVDHFLGMATVLNIVGVRLANRIVEPVLNAEHVESVDIVFDDDHGLEGRAGYYDGAGAMVDMLQSHLLQVLSLVAMEPPPTLSNRDLGDCRAQALRAVRVWDDDPVASSYRARYTAGEIDGHRFRSYVDGAGVDPSRNTETLAELVLAVDNWRWTGVPFRLRSGKALGNPRKEVVISFKAAQRVPVGLAGCDQPNRLRIGIFRAGPDRLCLDFNISGPGDPSVIDPVTLEAEFGAGDLFEYGEVLKGVLEGDATLSVRDDMATECWRIIEPVQHAWRDDKVPLEEYAAGSGGPDGWPL